MSEIGGPSGIDLRRQAAMLGDAPFAAVLIDQPHVQASTVDALLAELSGPDTRIARLHDPLYPHRKLHRIMAQVAGAAGEVSRGDQARLVVRALAERQAQERRVLLVIERAETLRPELLRSLQAMAPYFNEGFQPALQVLFVGRPIFRTLLDQQGIAPLRQALGFGVPMARTAISRRSWRRPLLLLVSVLVAAGCAGYFALREPGPSFDRAFRAQDVPSPLEALPPVAPELPPPGAFAPAPAMAPVPVAPPDRPTIVPVAPRFVLHVPIGSDAAVATSGRLVADLRPRSGTVEVGRVPDTPARPSLRYYYPADAAVARQAASWMADSGLIWVVQDFSSYRPLPSRGTVGVWLPRLEARALVGLLNSEQPDQR